MVKILILLKAFLNYDYHNFYSLLTVLSDPVGNAVSLIFFFLLRELQTLFCIFVLRIDKWKICEIKQFWPESNKFFIPRWQNSYPVVTESTSVCCWPLSFSKIPLYYILSSGHPFSFWSASVIELHTSWGTAVIALFQQFKNLWRFQPKVPPFLSCFMN